MNSALFLGMCLCVCVCIYIYIYIYILWDVVPCDLVGIYETPCLQVITWWIFFSSVWRWRHQFHLKQWYPYSKLHHIASQNVIFIPVELPFNDSWHCFLLFNIQLLAQVSTVIWMMNFLHFKVFWTSYTNPLLSKRWLDILTVCMVFGDGISALKQMSLLGYDLQW